MRFHGLRHPVEMGAAEVTAFLTHRVTERGVSASTQSQAASALLLYGGGLRLLEPLRLRDKDVDLERREIAVRSGKGERDRVTVLPGAAVSPLREKLERNRAQWERDVRRGGGRVALPDAFARKSPRAAARVSANVKQR